MRRFYSCLLHLRRLVLVSSYLLASLSWAVPYTPPTTSQQNHSCSCRAGSCGMSCCCTGKQDPAVLEQGQQITSCASDATHWVHHGKLASHFPLFPKTENILDSPSMLVILDREFYSDPESELPQKIPIITSSS